MSRGPSRYWQSKTPEQRLRHLRDVVRLAKADVASAREDGDEEDLRVALSGLQRAERHVADEKRRQEEARAKEQAKRTARTRARRERKRRSDARKESANGQ